MKIQDLRKKTVAELNKELADKGLALHNFKFGSVGKSKNTKAGKNLRKEIAQILTVLKEAKKA
jgi:ribosomal protein L29